MRERGVRKFYKESAVGASEDGFLILLDGRPVRTPLRALLCLPSAPLAEAVAAEWQAQVDFILPSTMPLTQLASTALDRMATLRSAMIDGMLRFAATDLLCYRADSPQLLAERQAALWQPILDWLTARFDAPLVVTTGIIAIPQPEKSLLALRRAVEYCDAFSLAGVQCVAAACSSLALALALAVGRLSADETFSIAQLDETYQAEHWGVDDMALERQNQLHADVRAAARFMSLARH